ncbi:hypothetical protein CPSG_00548 [Coccidioides posadasii str. Silveira]|uniref:Uncharacterized protein n=1 Tax=Coccidioides posadasii (strain RMSCC 757 / Silveira) TaxID=443226 RepID=E9CSI9_COCPS|nr:hypothetical protein CPSG_00548 [Coccidioides posadasii str. Silveira]
MIHIVRRPLTTAKPWSLIDENGFAESCLPGGYAITAAASEDGILPDIRETGEHQRVIPDIVMSDNYGFLSHGLCNSPLEFIPVNRLRFPHYWTTSAQHLFFPSLNLLAAADKVGCSSRFSNLKLTVQVVQLYLLTKGFGPQF